MRGPAFAILFCAVVHASGPVRGDHVEAELVAEHESVQPGGVVLVGIRLQLDPHWHVYWKNPGDAGLPPRIQWKLPEGVQAGPVEWPAPERITMGTFVNLGYSGEVLLPVEVRVPDDYEGDTLPVAATVDWQVCDDSTCVLGDATLDLTLAVLADAPRPGARAGLFARARERIPGDAPAGLVTAAPDGDRVLLTVRSGADRLFFFPEQDGVVAYDQPFSAKKDRTVLELTRKNPNEPLDRLRGVLVLEGGRGRESFIVEVAVEEPEPEGGYAGIALALAVVAGVLLVVRLSTRKKGESE